MSECPALFDTSEHACGAFGADLVLMRKPFSVGFYDGAVQKAPSIVEVTN
jgi:hypothetical protein